MTTAKPRVIKADEADSQTQRAEIAAWRRELVAALRVAKSQVRALEELWKRLSGDTQSELR
jgi:hypothetical protein